MTDFLFDQLPFLAHSTQFTLAGLAITSLAAVLYFATRTPEFLLVALVAVLYVTVPHLPHLV